MSARQKAIGDQRQTLLAAQAITTALAGTIGGPVIGLVGMKYLVAEANFTYGSGGTTTDVYIQTSVDGGATWIDIMNFHFTTASGKGVSAVVMTTALAANVSPGDGALAANTILSGLLGDRVRAKLVTTGTYASSTSITVDITAKG